MKLYRIAKWNEIYENNRSRQVKDLSWVPIQNKMDGENFTQIMGHPKGAMIFSGFILMVELASRCTPRGCLVRGNGQPHNVRTMAAKCRCPDVWFSTAIDYLISNTDWLEVTEIADVQEEASCCHPPDVILTPSRQAGDEERNGKNGKEMNGSGYAVPQCFEGVEGFVTALADWVEMRKKIKKPPTGKAIQMMIDELAKRPAQAVKALEMAVRASWQGFEWSWFDGRNPQPTLGIRENIKAKVFRPHES